MTESVKAGRRRIAISHPERVMFPEAGVTKLDLARHYARVGALMVPLVRERPLALQTFPAGITEKGFFLKSRPKHFPEWIATAQVPKREGGTNTQVLADSAPVLVYLSGQNMVTPHIWTARADRLEQPDRIVFDLDPPPERSFSEVRATARALGDLLVDLGMHPFAMTTGSRGIHVDVAIRRSAGYGEVHAFAHAVADRLVRDSPGTLTTEFHVKNRGDRIFIDVGRNAYGQHAVAPYAVRALPAAPVATPLAWAELEEATLTAQSWTLRTLGDRIADVGDPWQGVPVSSLPEARRRLGA
jgi:bifunctional non-homologous end joining protein LigD